MPLKNGRLPDNFPELCRAAGLKVVEIDGWEDRDRPGSHVGAGTLWHHTGSSGNGLAMARWMALDGRADLPAPLSQLSLDRQGTVFVAGAGRANHAGKAKASGPMAAGDGNTIYVGVECHNNGTEGFGKDQYEAMVTLAVVIMKCTKGSAATNRAHKETSVTGKWDPGALDMLRFREDIEHAATGTRAPKMTHVQRSRIALGQSIAALRKALEELDDAGASRGLAKAQRDEMAHALGELVGAHGRMPVR